jgi:hypothetical protein
VVVIAVFEAKRVLIGNLKIKRKLGKPKRRWEDNIKIYLSGVEWEGVNLINVSQDREN